MNTDEQTATAAPIRKAKHIAIVAATAALASAMESVLAPKMTGYTFSHVKRISERPAGASIASLGLPSFVPGNDGITVHSFGSRIIDNATPEQRSKQWETLRSATASVEEVLAELNQRVDDYIILSGAAIKDTKLAISEVRCEIAEAETLEDKCAAYRKGFELLMAQLA